MKSESNMIARLKRGSGVWNAWRSANPFKFADLSYSDLRGANLRGANLSNSDLRGANLSYSDLRGANLSNSDLRGTYLSYSDLRGANLSYSDLSNSDLRGANLSYSDLSNSDLSGSDLRGANLSNSGLRGSIFSTKTLWPSALMLLGTQWGNCSDRLTLDLMRYDADNHVNPVLFIRWAKTGDCPYSNSVFQRAALFAEKRALINPKTFIRRKVKSAVVLATALLAEHCHLKN